MLHIREARALGVVRHAAMLNNYDYSSCIRFVTAANPAALADFERSLFGPFTAILQGDVVGRSSLLAISFSAHC